MATHTIALVVRVVCRCKAKAGLRRLPRGLHKRTQLSSVLRLNMDSSLKTTWFHSAAVHFPRAWHYSKCRHQMVGFKASTRNGRYDPKCPSARPLSYGSRRHRTPSEGATIVWIAADEAVVCTRAFLTMWRSSRRLVFRGRVLSNPDQCVNDIHLSDPLVPTPSHNTVRAA
ncbi:uncharacterized protein TNCV_3631291 [Trichonephila clavipes]|nr:uncharacterized protein TNCV_3631291 [Trichonephila clavipes]